MNAPAISLLSLLTEYMKRITRELLNVAKEPPFVLFNIPKMSEFIWRKLLSEKQTIKKQLPVGLMLVTTV